MSDLARLFSAEENVNRWMAERENATARLDLARIEKHSAYLISQHEPLAIIGIDRDKLLCVLAYLSHGDLRRLEREIQRTDKGVPQCEHGKLVSENCPLCNSHIFKKSDHGNPRQG